MGPRNSMCEGQTWTSKIPGEKLEPCCCSHRSDRYFSRTLLKLSQPVKDQLLWSTGDGSGDGLKSRITLAWTVPMS